MQGQLHLWISRGAAILHPADLVNPFLNKGATTFRARPCKYTSLTEPTHTKIWVDPNTASTITTKKELNKTFFLYIYWSNGIVREKNVNVTNLTKQHRLSDLDYQLRKVKVITIQAASGNWLDRNPENVKLSECHLGHNIFLLHCTTYS